MARPQTRLRWSSRWPAWRCRWLRLPSRAFRARHEALSVIHCLHDTLHSAGQKHSVACVPACVHVVMCPFASTTSYVPQVAHVSLEGVRGEVRRSSGGSLAASVTIAGLQVDNQLVTTSRPVVLCASQQVSRLGAR